MKSYSIPLPDPDALFGRRVRILFEGVYYPEHPYIAYVFVTEAVAGEVAAMKENPCFAGSFSMMGRPIIPGNEERGLLPWARPAFAGSEEPDQPATIWIDATAALSACGRGQNAMIVNVELRDLAGHPLPDEILRCDAVTLEVV